MSHPKPELTIAVVTYNSWEYTEFFLDSLQQHADVPFTLIVVDNQSTDGTQEKLLARKDIDEVILNDTNMGFGPANNQVFAKTKTPYFLGLNNDTAIGPGFLSALLDYAHQHEDYAEFGVHSNCIGAQDPETGEEVNQLMDTGLPQIGAFQKYMAARPSFMTDFAKKNPGLSEFICPPHFIGGWGFLVRTDAVKKAGGLFDERFEIGFWEDVDLSWRLGAAGYQVGLINELYLHHFTHVSFNDSAELLDRSDKKISQANSLRFAKKWDVELRTILQEQFAKGKSLDDIRKDVFIMNAYFKKDYSPDGRKAHLRKHYIEDKDISFDTYLRRYVFKENTKT